MEVAQQYRWEAERLRQLAEMAASENVRAELLNIAAQFEQLADAAERGSAGDEQSAFGPDNPIRRVGNLPPSLR